MRTAIHGAAVLVAAAFATPLAAQDTADERLAALLDKQVDAVGQALNDPLRDHVKSVAADPKGIAVSVYEYDAAEYMTRVRVVRNTVEIDPNAPTLSEVREMMDEAAAEATADEETL